MKVKRCYIKGVFHSTSDMLRKLNVKCDTPMSNKPLSRQLEMLERKNGTSSKLKCVAGSSEQHKERGTGSFIYEKSNWGFGSVDD